MVRGSVVFVALTPDFSASFSFFFSCLTADLVYMLGSDSVSGVACLRAASFLSPP